MVVPAISSFLTSLKNVSWLFMRNTFPQRGQKSGYQRKKNIHKEFDHNLGNLCSSGLECPNLILIIRLIAKLYAG
jgi:hypothetical protein